MPTNLRWLHACIISLLVVTCTWLLLTRGEEVFPGHTQPYRLPLLPFFLLAAAVLIASGWHRRLMPRSSRATGTDRGYALWAGAIVAFWVLGLPLWHQLGARVTGEGIAYYVYLRSAVFDGDLDFSNEYEAFNLDDDDPTLLYPTRTGLPRNAHAVGPAVVWSPFLLAARAVQSLRSDSDEAAPFETRRRKREALDQDALGRGYAYPFVSAAALGSLFLIGLASLLWYREMARTMSPQEAAIGAVGVIAAGPLLWYSFFEPSMSHAPTAACLVFAMVAWRQWTRDPLARRALLVGLTAGLVAMQRWQFILWVAVPLAQLLFFAVRRDHLPGTPLEPMQSAPDDSSGTQRARDARWPASRAAGQLALIIVGTLIGLLPQFVAWKLVWGNWLVNPMGGGFLSWSEPQILSVVWSQRHGLFTWHPILLLAVLGFIPAWRKDRGLTAVCVALLVSMVYVNGAVADWWAMDSFGHRRFAGLYPAFAWGLSGAFASLRGARWRRALLALLLAGALFNLGLAHGYRTGVIRRDWWVSAGDAMRCQVVAVQDAAQWSLRWTAEHFPMLGGPLYGVIDGRFMLDSRGLSPTVNIGSGDREYVGEGWVAAEQRPGARGVQRTFRWIVGTSADLWLPLRHMRDHRLNLSGWPLGGSGTQRLAVSVNGEFLSDPVVMRGEGTWQFPIAEAVLRHGPNRIRLHLASASPPSDADRRALSAAFDRISIEVPADP